MHPDAVKAYLETLLDYIFDILYVRNCWGVNHAEFMFVQVARLLRRYPDLKPWFLHCVEHTVSSSIVFSPETTARPEHFVAEELIEYIAHATRWVEFQEIALAMQGNPQDQWKANPLRTWSATLLSALQDDWEDRDMYSSLEPNGSSFV